MLGPDVLLLHDVGSSAGAIQSGWVVRFGEAGRRVIAVDLLGHGDAAKPSDPGSYSRAGLAALQSFDALAGGQPTLIDAVGIGAGGQLLLRLASALQDRFRRIVAVAVDASAMPAAADGAADGADGVWRTDPAHDSQDSAVAAFRAGALRPLEPRMLARVIAACRLIVGEQDDVGPLLAELPDADVQRLAGFDRSHAPFDERVIDAAAHFVVDGV